MMFVKEEKKKKRDEKRRNQKRECDNIRWSSLISSRHASARNCVIFLKLLKTDDDHSFLNRAIKMGQWKLPQIRC